MGLFGPDKIILRLDKYDFKPGEEINGTIDLNLKKPVEARKLEVSLIGTRKTRRGNNTSWEKFYSFEIPVSGPKEYQVESHDFKMKIPTDLLNYKNAQQAMQDSLEDKLGSAGTFISAVTVGTSQVKWKLVAQLDVPKKLDVKAKQDIIINE